MFSLKINIGIHRVVSSFKMLENLLKTKECPRKSREIDVCHNIFGIFDKIIQKRARLEFFWNANKSIMGLGKVVIFQICPRSRFCYF